MDLVKGILKFVIRGQTKTKNPKITLDIQEDPNNQYAAHVHFSGRDLTQVPANIDQFVGFNTAAQWEPFTIPATGSIMKMGRHLFLPDSTGKLPPLPEGPPPGSAPPPSQEAPFPNQVPAPAPAAAGPPAAAPPVQAGPPPPTQAPPAQAVTAPATQAPPASARPAPVKYVPTPKDLHIARQACIKSPILIQQLIDLHGPGFSTAVVRQLCDYYVNWVYDITPRISPSQHRQIEALITKTLGTALRGDFKKWLYTSARYYEIADAGGLHLTDLSREHGEYLIKKWASATSSFTAAEAKAAEAKAVGPGLITATEPPAPAPQPAAAPAATANEGNFILTAKVTSEEPPWGG